MKIKQSQLEQIINEEIQGMLSEQGWKDKLAGIGSSIMGSTYAQEFMKGFAGNAPGDNPFSQLAYRAVGVSLVPQIDKLFSDIIKKVDELKTHEEGKNVIDPDAKGGKSTKSPDELLKNFQESLQILVMDDWVKMTIRMRQAGGATADGPGAAGEEEAGSEEAGEEMAPTSHETAPEEEEEESLMEGGIAEIIRQQVREALKERAALVEDDDSRQREQYCAKLADGSTKTIHMDILPNTLLTTIRSLARAKLKKEGVTSQMKSLTKGACK